jgi:hypothetical protein
MPTTGYEINDAPPADGELAMRPPPTERGGVRKRGFVGGVRRWNDDTRCKA